MKFAVSPHKLLVFFSKSVPIPVIFWSSILCTKYENIPFDDFIFSILLIFHRGMCCLKAEKHSSNEVLQRA